MKDKLKIFLNLTAVNTIYKLLKQIYKYGHKIITGFKALVYYIVWSILKKHKLYKELKVKYEITQIRPYKPLRWKHKVEYLYGVKNQKKVFIKTAGVVNTIYREIVALTEARNRSKILADHIPELYVNANQNDFVIEEKIEGNRLDTITEWDSPEQKSEIIRQLFLIYLELKRINIIHMDIRPSNFILRKDDAKLSLYLIDFGFSLVDTKDIFWKIKNNSETRKILANLGSDYSLHNETWDDAYSFLITLKSIEPSLMKNYRNIWMTLNDDMGEKTVTM